MTCRAALFVSLILLGFSGPPAGAAELVTGAAAVTGPARLNIGGTTVRLADIRMPGPEATCVAWQGRRQAGYSCHLHARAVLESLVADRTVACVPQTEKLATCYVDGRDIAETVIELGWGRACGRTSRYVDMEEAARNASRGLWAGQFSLTEPCPESRADKQ